MRVYDYLSEADKELTDKYCPYKEGDKLKITRTIIGCDKIQTDVMMATVIEVFLDPTRKSDVLCKVPLHLMDCVEVDEIKLNSIDPHFIIRYKYDKLQPRSKWWRLWEKRTYKEEEDNVTVDQHGYYTPFTCCIDYRIEKI